MAELRVLDRHRATRDGCPLGLPENGNASQGWRYSLLPQHHHRSFQPNCTWRDVVEVLVMAPAVPDKPVRCVAVGGVFGLHGGGRDGRAGGIGDDALDAGRNLGARGRPRDQGP